MAKELAWGWSLPKGQVAPTPTVDSWCTDLPTHGHKTCTEVLTEHSRSEAPVPLRPTWPSCSTPCWPDQVAPPCKRSWCAPVYACALLSMHVLRFSEPCVLGQATTTLLPTFMLPGQGR